ncbi:hypothetical protein [Microcoleus anatoxicus]|uniref:Uncharacterized protein n=1 Tax=Microcoleus anatoxicus PTRS2 TaxID=2705321 RepID=A0ABU8YT96_9CYAN
MVFFPKCDATFSVGIYEDWSKYDRPYCPKGRSPFLKLKYKLSD